MFTINNNTIMNDLTIDDLLDEVYGLLLSIDYTQTAGDIITISNDTYSMTITYAAVSKVFFLSNTKYVHVTHLLNKKDLVPAVRTVVNYLFN